MGHAQEQAEQTDGSSQTEALLVDGEVQDLALLYGPHLDQGAAQADCSRPSADTRTFAV